MNYMPGGPWHDSTTPAAQDRRDQSTVLNHILHLYPQALTLEELSRELTNNSPDFDQRDWVERAVTELIATGLLHRVGALILPTRAATHFYGIGI